MKFLPRNFPVEDGTNDNLTVVQVLTNTKQTIIKLFTDNNLKATDLSTEFHNWETDLNKLNDKEKIKEFQQKIWREIQVKKDKKKQNSENNQGKGLSLPVKLLIGGGVVMVILVLAGVIWFRAKKKKKKPVR